MNNYQRRNDIIISIFALLVSIILILLYINETFPDNKKWGNLINDTIPSIMAVLIGYPIARLILKPIDLYDNSLSSKEIREFENKLIEIEQNISKTKSEKNEIAYAFGFVEVIDETKTIIQKAKKELFFYVPDFHAIELLKAQQIKSGSQTTELLKDQQINKDNEIRENYINFIFDTISSKKLDAKLVFNYFLYEEETPNLIKERIKQLKNKYQLNRCGFYIIKNKLSLGFIVVDSKYLIKTYSTSDNDYRANNAIISTNEDHVNSFNTWLNNYIMSEAKKI